MFLRFYDGTSVFRDIRVVDTFSIYAVGKNDIIVVSINGIGFEFKQKKFRENFSTFSFKFYELIEQEVIKNIHMSSELIKMVFEKIE